MDFSTKNKIVQNFQLCNLLSNKAHIWKVILLRVLSEYAQAKKEIVDLLKDKKFNES